MSLDIHCDLLQNMENYLHLIGRSGRFGGKGVAINFVASADVQAMRIAEFHHTQIKEMPTTTSVKGPGTQFEHVVFVCIADEQSMVIELVLSIHSRRD